MDIKEIRRPLIFHLYIIVAEPRAPIIYLALIFQGHFQLPALFSCLLFCAQFIGSKKVRKQNMRFGRFSHVYLIVFVKQHTHLYP